MDDNPLSMLAEQLKQKQLNDKLQALSDEIKYLKENKTMKLIELEIFQMAGSVRHVTKATINPDQIVAIKEDGDHADIYMTNDCIIQTILTREEVVKLIEGHYTPPKSYVG
jgi:hypothetical protein